MLLSPGHVTQKVWVKYNVSFTHVDMILDKRPEFSIKWRVSGKLF